MASSRRPRRRGPPTRSWPLPWPPRSRAADPGKAGDMRAGALRQQLHTMSNDPRGNGDGPSADGPGRGEGEVPGVRRLPAPGRRSGRRRGQALRATRTVLASAVLALAHSGTPAAKANRLIRESSPYLLLHAHNPVDWYPWGEEAIEKARREGKPIFLSVGYSTCYWCHVMEREVFYNPAIAAQMNQWFVSIKVDREERPDLDEIYITATELMNRSAGWPNSLFLTPDLKPFFAGTYFPPEDRGGLPGFPRVLQGIHTAWQTRRPEVLAQADKLTEELRDAIAQRREPAAAVPALSAVTAAVARLEASFDPAHGGFGGPPKF